MSIDLLPYLSSLQNSIRIRSIAWEGAARIGTISEEQLNKIRAVDNGKKETRKQVVENDLDGYRTLFLGAEGKPGVLEAVAKRSDMVQNILVLFSDLFEEIPALPKSFSQHTSPFSELVVLLTESNDPESPVRLLTSTVLTTLIVNNSVESQEKTSALSELFKYLSSLTETSDGGLQDIAVLQYSSLLRDKISRKLFWAQRKQTISPLISILRIAAGIPKGDSLSQFQNSTSTGRGNVDGTLAGDVGLQLLYHILLVLWQVSFEGSIAGEGLQGEYGIIPLYVQLLRLSPKEKITRLLVSSLYNLLTTNRQKLLPIAVLSSLPVVLHNINGRHHSDPDLLEDLKNLTEVIDYFTKTQTTFDEYAVEVNSGHLIWSPPHRNSKFWSENARKILEYEEGALLRKLAEIMAKSWEDNKQVLAIACNDIGSLVREMPEKRFMLEKLGFKKRVMELMQDSDESIRWESLNALSGWLKYSFER